MTTRLIGHRPLRVTTPGCYGSSGSAKRQLWPMIMGVWTRRAALGRAGAVIGHLRSKRIARRNPGVVEPSRLRQPQPAHDGLGRFVEDPAGNGSCAAGADARARDRVGWPSRFDRAPDAKLAGVLVAATRPAAVVEVSYGRANSDIRRAPRGLSPLVGSGHGLMLRKIRLVIAIA